MNESNLVFVFFFTVQRLVSDARMALFLVWRSWFSPNCMSKAPTNASLTLTDMLEWYDDHNVFMACTVSINLNEDRRIGSVCNFLFKSFQYNK